MNGKKKKKKKKQEPKSFHDIFYSAIARKDVTDSLIKIFKKRKKREKQKEEEMKKSLRHLFNMGTCRKLGLKQVVIQHHIK